KQMDNRIKLLEEILSFRMQGVEFDNGDMYVDGHKAASDVRDEFVSVTEKLMDELAQCYNVLPQLDINNTIDHRPEGEPERFLPLDITSLLLHVIFDARFLLRQKLRAEGEIGRAVQQECRDRTRMPSSA